MYSTKPYRTAGSFSEKEKLPAFLPLQQRHYPDTLEYDCASEHRLPHRGGRRRERMICPCNVAFISFVLQQTVIARKYFCIRTPLELGKVQKVKIKKKFRKRLLLSYFRNFFVHRTNTNPNRYPNRSPAKRVRFGKGRRTQQMCNFRGSYANRGNGTELSSSDVVREVGLEVHVFHFMYSNPSILAK